MRWADNGCNEFPDVHGVKIPKIDGRYSEEMILDQPGFIGGGGNSGFQALNLAVLFGSRRIILIGFDMNDRSGVHWYGRNNWKMANNPDATNFRRWISAFERAAPILADAGVEVVNAAENSSLRCFKRWSIEDTMKAWA